MTESEPAVCACGRASELHLVLRWMGDSHQVKGNDYFSVSEGCETLSGPYLCSSVFLTT